MKYTDLLPFIAGATAFVIPDEATAKGLIIETERKAEETLSSWWNHDVPSFVEDTLEDTFDAFERQASNLDARLSDIVVESEIPDFLSLSEEDGEKKPGHGRPGHDSGHHGAKNLTVYQAISASSYTSKFAALVGEYPEIVKTLNSTEANITLFVPTNRAFEKIPDHYKDKTPPKEYIEKLLQYHVAPGLYPAGRLLAHHTVPTALKLEALGDNPQRVRVSIGLFGVRLNFYSKLIAANVVTKNGIIHGLDNFLAPPPAAGRLLSLFPSKFSTLLLAAEKTGLHEHAKEHPTTTGLTVFAPTNFAFQKLGPGANAFLFNTEKGLHYLKALLLYHIVANETLYSDQYYGKPNSSSSSSGGETEESSRGWGRDGHHHVDLPSLLGGKPLSIDIARFHRIISIRVNGRTKVSIQDALASDGVVHVVDSVIIPPHRHRGGRHDGAWWEGGEDEDEEAGEEIEVGELVERLRPFVDLEDESAAGAEEWVGEL
ncbi:hypothetical protein SLS62_003424 [Diatrype stigma]|uniref:FAS1 domain-containing protein n=1 Tax=Diatrype stigma TaxID=117547 RepID=A0AAN9YUQ2_9PEZI